MPVCIRAHALGENIPARDLYVTPGHSLLIDTTLVLARNLVNGVTITNDWAPARIDYFNIELAHHECIRAEGCWAETFAEGDGLRSAFHNEAEYHALYPDSVGGKTLSLCAPRFLRGAGLEAALRPIVARCQSLVKPGPLRGYIDGTQEGRIEGWAQDSSHPELPVLLEVWAGGRLLGTVLACDERHDLREAGIARGLCAFTFTTDAELKDVQVRRSGDGAALAMTVDCRMKAA